MESFKYHYIPRGTPAHAMLHFKKYILFNIYIYIIYMHIKYKYVLHLYMYILYMYIKYMYTYINIECFIQYVIFSHER